RPPPLPQPLHLRPHPAQPYQGGGRPWRTVTAPWTSSAKPPSGPSSRACPGPAEDGPGAGPRRQEAGPSWAAWKPASCAKGTGAATPPLTRYLSKCGRLFNGVRCTDECRGVIEDMMQVPKALLLNDCVCDGLERPICESIKENMARLCFGAELGNGGPGSSGNSDYDYEDEYDEEGGPDRGTGPTKRRRTVSSPETATGDQPRPTFPWSPWGRL
ncbi:unnamed protein product, partial [Staurois parvus]